MEFQGTMDAADVEMDEVPSLHLLSLISATASLNLEFLELPSLANQSQHEYEVVNSKTPRVNE